MAFRVAIVHDWLTVYAGAERLLEQLLIIFPQADLFTLVDHIPEEGRQFLRGKPVRTSFIQKMPFSKKLYRQYLPLMPLAIEQFDVSAYDLVVSSSYAVAKGIVTGPDQFHLCYCHSPMRYAWDLQHQYLKESGLDKGVRSALARAILHYLRLWDVRTANGVDAFVTNSQFVARRIWKTYRREAEVLYGPVVRSQAKVHHRAHRKVHHPEEQDRVWRFQFDFQEAAWRGTAGSRGLLLLAA